MEDVPQPASDPYELGRYVRVYVGEDDQDVRWHGTRCRVVDVVEDDLDEETGRSIDAVSYRLIDVETGEQLSVSFRHRDLVPVD